MRSARESERTKGIYILPSTKGGANQGTISKSVSKGNSRRTVERRGRGMSGYRKKTREREGLTACGAQSESQFRHATKASVQCEHRIRIQDWETSKEDRTDEILGENIL